MSSSLDKLKALTSKLESKLEKKEKSPQKPAVVVSKKEVVEEKKTVKKVSTPTKKPFTKTSGSIKKGTSNNAQDVREENIERVEVLFEKLKIFEKAPDFENIFVYKAMNLSGIGLKEEDFAQAREGKYIQVIAITYEPDKNGKKKAKNISLGYFGKAETLEVGLKNEIIEFVLRWRYEKAFQNVEHYKDLIARVEVPSSTLF